MEVLSTAASIFAVLQLTTEVIEYLKHCNDFTNDSKNCLAEASDLHNLLNHLLYHVNRPAREKAWSSSLRTLTSVNGPLDQCKHALEELLAKVEIQGYGQHLKKRLLWRFSKAHVVEILVRIERVKSLIMIALETDHL